MEEEIKECQLWKISIVGLSSSMMPTIFFNILLLVKQLRGNHKKLAYTCLYLYLNISGKIFPWIF
jgi:hypothetical protein